MRKYLYLTELSFYVRTDISKRKITLVPLYVGSQCKTCGERMESAKMRDHMDDHFRENMQKKKISESRGWFGNSWNGSAKLKNDGGMKNRKRKLETEENLSVACFGKLVPECDLCKETFKQKYNQVCYNVVLILYKVINLRTFFTLYKVH